MKNLFLTVLLLFSVSFATEIYFGNVDQSSGTAEVLYTTDVEIGGFQFDFIGGTVADATGGEAENSQFTISTSAHTILGFSFSGASLAIGEGLTLLTVNFEPDEDATEFCLEGVVLSNTGGETVDYTVGPCAQALQIDCNGELGGDAVEDECGVCEGDGIIQDCGCGTPGEFGLPDGACDCEGNVLDFCGDCGGTGQTEEDCVEGYQLFIGAVDEASGTAEVWYSAEDEIGGAQFDVSGIGLTGASGGQSESVGWIVSTSATTWLGFSFSNFTIPAGINLLTILTFDTEEAGDFCLNGVVLSNSSGEGLDATVGECIELLGTDCLGVIGGGAIEDECGVCDGDGVIQECGCGSPDEFGLPDGACDCEGNVFDFCGDCGGTGQTEEDCVEGYSIYFENLDQVAGTVDVYYASEGEIGGAQFSVNGITLTGSSGGVAEEYEWTVSTSATVWLGFSFANVALPAGIHLLSSLTFIPPGDGDELCLENVILSDIDANGLDVDLGECLQLFDFDCFGELGGNAELDECGVCEGGNADMDECDVCFGDGASCAPGTFDVYYDIDVDFGGFQFNVNGTTVTGAGGGIAEELDYTINAGESGVVLGFSFSATPIPAGDGLLVVVDTEGPNDDACISDLVISDTDAISLDAFIVNCNTITFCEDVDGDDICDVDDDCVGVVDDCGVCNGNNANMDDCGVCDEDPTNDCVELAIMYDFGQDITGFQFDVNGVEISPGSAFGGSADEYYDLIETNILTVVGVSYDNTPIPAGNGVLTNVMVFGDIANASLSNVILTDIDAQEIPGTIDGLTIGVACIDFDQDGICVSDDIDDNCYSNILDCADVCDGDAIEDFCGVCNGTGQTEDDCVEGYTVYFENIDQVAGTVDVYYASESPIGGAQFTISGISLTGASGGEAELGEWTVSTSESLWLGFSMSNTPLSSGRRMLTTLEFVSPGEGNELCFTDVILSSTEALPFDVVIGDCLGLDEYDCNGELGGTAELDECGVCEGSGPAFECWNGSFECTAEDCVVGGTLTFGEQTSNIIPVYISTNSEIAGFQFEISGAELVDAFGGVAEENGFTLQVGNGVVLGFSFDGSTIPAGDHLLLNLELGQSDETEMCFVEGSGVLSGSDTTQELLVVLGECAEVILDITEIISVGEFRLTEVYPNPFNAQSTIKYSVPSTEFVDISVYDINGQKIHTLVSRQVNSGNHEINWNAGDIPSGVYFIMLSSDNFVQTQRVTLMK